MATKSIEARVVCKSDDKHTTEQKKRFLWLTHKLFNESVARVIPFVFKMKRGELGPEFQAIYYSIRSSQDAIGKLEATTKQGWSSGKVEKSSDAEWKKLLDLPKLDDVFREQIRLEGEKNTARFRKELEKKRAEIEKSIKMADVWAQPAMVLQKRKQLLFDRELTLPNQYSEFRRKIFEMTIQRIHGHQELLANWEDEHAEWLKRKDEWEEDHPDYMLVRPVFEKFEEEAGKLRGSRKRWLLYLDFLAAHPELAAWRGQPPLVTPLTEEERKNFKKPGEHFRAFFEKNPELSELDRLNNYYQREFARSQAQKRNSDGFKHRPTFTLPSPERHPDWFSFKKKDSYSQLNLSEKTIDLKVITDEQGNSGHVGYEFLPDDRLNAFVKVGTSEKGKKAKSFTFYDPILECSRPAEIKGIKLVFRPARPDGVPHFIFSIDIEEQKPSVKIGPALMEDDESGRKKRKKRDVPDGLVTLAVDYGQRHLGAVTVCQNINGEPSQRSFLPAYLKPKKGHSAKPVSAWLATIPGLTFNALKTHERQYSAAKSRHFKDPLSRRQAGDEGAESSSRHIPKNERFLAHLRDHLANMKEDHYKKAAHLIIKTAVKNGAQVILLENLKNYRPMLERTNKENRSRMLWAVRNTAQFLEQSAKPLGIMVRYVSPAYTSRMCSACGHPGARVTLPTQKHWEKFYAKKHGPNRKMIVEHGGKFFVCPNCGKTMNADVNASLNMHKVFYGSFDWPEKTKDKQFIWRGSTWSWDLVADMVEKKLNGEPPPKPEPIPDLPF